MKYIIVNTDTNQYIGKGTGLIFTSSPINYKLFRSPGFAEKKAQELGLHYICNYKIEEVNHND